MSPLNVCKEIYPMTTNLFIADTSRTEKTIRLAVSPALKSFGIPGRPRLFEVIQAVNRVNSQRKSHAPGRNLVGSSYNLLELNSNLSLALDYVVAPPQMVKYLMVEGYRNTFTELTISAERLLPPC